MIRPARQGYTLIELMTVLFIGLVIGGTIIATLLGQMQITSTQNRNIINQQNLRESLDYVADEISSTGAGVDEPYIDTLEDDDFRFIADIDGDGNWNRMRYWLDNGTLSRQLEVSNDEGANWTTISTDVVLSGVENLEFTYYAANNAAPGNADEVTSVELRVTLDVGHETTAMTAGKLAGTAMVARATLRNRLLD